MSTGGCDANNWEKAAGRFRFPPVGLEMSEGVGGTPEGLELKLPVPIGVDKWTCPKPPPGDEVPGRRRGARN